MKPETKLKVKVLNGLRGIQDSYFEKIQQQTICGTPDIIGCVPYDCHRCKQRFGLFVGMELKQGNGQPTKLQSFKLEQIHRAGGLALVVNEKNYQQAVSQLRDLSAGKTWMQPK